MGDIDKEDPVSYGTRLGLNRHRLSHDFLPGSEDRIGLQGGIDLQCFEGFFKDRMEGLGFSHVFLCKFQMADLLRLHSVQD